MTTSFIRSKLNSIIGYFIRGLVFITPIMLTFVIIKWGITTLDHILPFQTPGLGLLVILLTIPVFGYFGSRLFYKPFFEWFENILENTPGIKVIYSLIKDFMEAFMGEKKRFNEPVLVKMNESGLLKIGFITSKDLSTLDNTGGLNDYVGIYFPHSYNFSGNHFLVLKSNVTPIKANSTEIMKFVVSGGVTEID